MLIELKVEPNTSICSVLEWSKVYSQKYCFEVGCREAQKKKKKTNLQTFSFSV